MVKSFNMVEFKVFRDASADVGNTLMLRFTAGIYDDYPLPGKGLGLEILDPNHKSDYLEYNLKKMIEDNNIGVDDNNTHLVYSIGYKLALGDIPNVIMKNEKDGVITKREFHYNAYGVPDVLLSNDMDAIYEHVKEFGMQLYNIASESLASAESAKTTFEYLNSIGIDTNLYNEQDRGGLVMTQTLTEMSAYLLIPREI